jgi:phosphoglycolate phosphatase-like HAD superfamily hydrolase
MRMGGNMRKYDLVIFDMDGTLMDTLDLHEQLFERFWEIYFSERIPVWTLSNNAATLRDMFEQQGITGDRLKETGEKLDHFYNNHVDDLIGQIRLVEGARQVLCEMRENGVVTALLTNSMSVLANRLVALSDAEDLFDMVLGADIYSVDKEERFRLLRDRYPTPSERILYVGDCELDADAAQVQGVDGCILYTPIGWEVSIGELMETYRPAYVVNDITKVGNIVL